MFAELLRLLRRMQGDSAARFTSLDAQLAAARDQAFELATDLIYLRGVSDAQTQLLHEILASVTLPAAASATLIYEGEDGSRIEGEHIEMKIPQNKQGTLSVTLKNASGGPGRVDGVPAWTASVEGVVELTPAADGMTCGVKTLPLASPDAVKTAVVTFAADGDMGDGVTNIVATFTATVYDPSGNTVLAEIVAGEFADVVPAPAES